MTSTDRALALPEIQTLILKAVHDISRRALLNCACVCSSWSDIALPFIWRGSPVIEDDSGGAPRTDMLLRFARNPQRLRYYIRHVKFLVLDRGFASRAEQFEILWDPFIWSAARHQYLFVGLRNQIMSDANLQLLLHSQLVVIELIGGVYSDRFIESLLMRCPSLRWLRLVGGSARITSNGLVRLLQTMQSLRGLHLFFVEGQSIINDDVLIQIMKLKYLSDLVIGKASEITEPLVQYSQQRLPCLQNLDLQYVDGAGLRALLAQLSHLESLVLMATETSSDFNLERDVLMPISEISSLAVLKLSSRARSFNLTLHGLSAVGYGCPNLRIVDISGTKFTGDMTLDYIPVLSIFASKLNLLESFKYNAPCVVNEFEIQTLACSCPLLETLVLRGDLQLRMFENMAFNVIFKNLRIISFDSYSWQGIGQVAHCAAERVHMIEKIKTELRRRIPDLQHLSPYGFAFEEGIGDKLSTEILTIINAGLENLDKTRTDSMHSFYARWLLNTFNK